MVASSPIDQNSIVRAATEMIREYGPDAEATARQHSKELRLEGFEPVAKTWDRISEAIKDMQEAPGA